jgi:hypothetical protein
VVVESGIDDDETVEVVFLGQLDDAEVHPAKLASHCDEEGIKRYSYDCSELARTEPK